MAANFSTICQAQNRFGDGEYPDFKRYFEVLEKNRVAYNKMNDSIFIIKDHDQWVNFFRRRALKNQQIFANNKELIGALKEYFKINQGKLPENVYVQMYYGMDKLNNDQTGDPFLAKTFCDILEKHYLETVVPDSLDYSGWVNVILGVNYYNISLLDKDNVMSRKAYEYFKKAAAIQKPKTKQAIRAKVEGLLNLIFTNWLTRKYQTVKEFRQCKKELSEMLKDSAVLRIVDKNLLRECRNLIKTADERLVRNVYLADTTVLDKQVADSLMRKIVERVDNSPKTNYVSGARALIMKVKLGQLTYAKAMEVSRKWYLKYKKELATAERYSPTELQANLVPFLNYFYFNDMADIPYSKKRKYVKEMCQIILQTYEDRKDQQKDNGYISTLNTLATYPRATKYLKPDERIFYLNSLNVATQVTTYAHSVHVGMIAEELMKAIVQYQPELLVGTLGNLQVTDILKNKQMYIDFAHDAALYHDLGKNSIISVVNNDYRPLTDEEFAIIKRHPELGLQYLELSPKLAKFHDTTLGHHKWYNGKGGYPDSFDNTKSPVRILIDIVTLSDCLQAATERIGRNYKGDKTFDMVMAEFRRDAGVRYNPDLVALIDAHPDLQRKLDELVISGWVDIYYKIYSQFIR